MTRFQWGGGTFWARRYRNTRILCSYIHDRKQWARTLSAAISSFKFKMIMVYRGVGDDNIYGRGGHLRPMDSLECTRV